MSQVTVTCEVAPGARIDPHARVGRWCVIGPDVEIGPGTVLEPRVTVIGRTILGADNIIGGGSVLGGHPQDLKYRGGPTWLVMGRGNRAGRNITAHVGTEEGGWVTFIGDGNVLEDTCHIAHDCYVAHGTRIGRGVLLGGHVVVQAGAVVGEMVGVQPYARIGRYSRVGPRTPVRRDVPPYVDYYSADYYWDPPMVRGLHEQGIAAAALDPAQEARLRAALTTLFDGESAMATKLEELQRDQTPDAELEHLCRFCRQSLSGLYGRYRELFRGQLPPEAGEYLPPWLLQSVQKEMSCR